MSQKAHTQIETRSEETSADTNINEHVEGHCPECDSRIITQDGERICRDCGLVVDDEQIDHGPEWRAFTHSEKQSKSRVGAPESVSIHDKGLSTKIDWRDRDANGNPLSPKRQRLFGRLRKWDEHGRTKGSPERTLKKAFTEIKRMTSSLGLPDHVSDNASQIFRRAVDQELLPGRSIEGVASASLYCACRVGEVPRTIAEVSDVSRVEEKKVSSAYRYLSQNLSLKLPPIEPESFLPAVASDVEATDLVRSEADNLLTAYVEDGEHSGKTVKAIAGASLYTANQLLGRPMNLTQADVADASGVTEVTIRHRREELLQFEDALETDPADVNGSESTETESTSQSSSYSSVDVDEVEVSEVDDGECVVAVPETGTQNNVLVTAVETLVAEYGLLESIDEMPYSPTRWRNYALVEDPDIDKEQTASWQELESGHYINTKIDKGQKTRLIQSLAEQCGVTMRFEGDW